MGIYRGWEYEVKLRLPAGAGTARKVASISHYEIRPLHGPKALCPREFLALPLLGYVPAPDKEIRLLREGEGGFGVFHAAPRGARGKMKNPPELSITRKSGQRLGGSAGWNIAIPVEPVK